MTFQTIRCTLPNFCLHREQMYSLYIYIYICFSSKRNNQQANTNTIHPLEKINWITEGEQTWKPPWLLYFHFTLLLFSWTWEFNSRDFVSRQKTRRRECGAFGQLKNGADANYNARISPKFRLAVFLMWFSAHLGEKKMIWMYWEQEFQFGHPNWTKK